MEDSPTTIILFLGGALLLGVVVLVAVKLLHGTASHLDQQFYKERWREIVSLTQNQSGWVQAIIEADKLLDDALKKSGYKGKTMGERLVSASRAFGDKDKVWAAHKLRNRVVHETSVKLREGHVNGAVKAFGKGLKDLGAL